jgi:hypothetical protein
MKKEKHPRPWTWDYLPVPGRELEQRLAIADADGHLVPVYIRADWPEDSEKLVKLIVQAVNAAAKKPKAKE